MTLLLGSFSDEFQKFHDEILSFIKDGKYEELLKYYSDNAIIMNHLHEPMTTAGLIS